MPTRRLFQGLLHTAEPSDAEFKSRYNLDPLPLTVRTSYAGWDDGDTTPSDTWFDNAAADLNPAHGWVLVDHEDWPMIATTQANRLETASKFVTLYNGLKSRRPDLNFGFYSYVPIFDYFRAREALDHSSYLAWQAENDDFAAMAAVVDGFFPPLYYHFTLASDGAGALTKYQAYMDHQILEAKRMRDQYGDPDRPIHPYIWWRKHDDSEDLDAEVWAYMIDAALGQSDGPVLWGGWLTGSGAITWDENATWWQVFRSKLPQRRAAGRKGRPAPAAGKWSL